MLPWDGEAMGELETRGPWVAAAYYETPEQADRWTDDGWFRTGDVVTIHPLGFIQIKDRSKDVIKSGGEWISSVELENALMAHPAIVEAAVIAVPDPKWDERPLAVGRAARTGRRRPPRSCATSWRRASRSGGSRIGSSSSPRSRRRASASSARPSSERCSRRTRRPRSHPRRDQDRLARQPAGQRRQPRDHRHAVVRARAARATTSA